MTDFLAKAFYWTGYTFLVASIAAAISVTALKHPAARTGQETVAFKTIEPFGVFWVEGGK